MKRRVLSIFLAALMLLSLFPAAAATSTAGPFTNCSVIDTVIENYQFSVASYSEDRRIQYYYYVPSGGVTVLVFFNAVDNYSNYLIESIANSSWIKNSYVNVVAIESSGADRFQVGQFMREYAGDMRDYFTVLYGNTELVKEYASLLGTSAGLPFTLMITRSAEYNYINYYGSYAYDTSWYTTPLNNLLAGNYGEDYNRPNNTVVVRVAGQEDWEKSYQIYDQTNRQRQIYGLSSLELNAALCEAAMQRAAELAIYYDTAHTRPNGFSYTSAVNGRFSELKENLSFATDYGAGDFVSAWMRSQADSTNILSTAYNQMGVGVFETDDRIFAVQLFGYGSSNATNRNTSRAAVRNVEIVPYNLNFTLVGDREITLPQGGTEKLAFGNTNALSRTFAKLVPQCSNDGTVVGITTDEDGNTVLTGLYPGEVTLTFRAYAGQTDGIKVHVTVKSRNLEGQCGEFATYYQDYAKGVLTVSGTGPMTNYTAQVVPEWDQNAVKTVVLRNGVTHVGNRAFANAANLTDISLSQDLVSIGENAFYGTAVSAVSIPASVVSIGDNAFLNCKNLKDIYYAGTQAMWQQICQDISDFNGVSVHCGTGTFPTSGSVGQVVTWSYVPESNTLVLLGSGSTWTGSVPQPFDVFDDSIHTLTLRTGVTELKSGMLAGLNNLEKITLASSVTGIELPHVAKLKELRLEGGATQWESLRKNLNLPTTCSVVLVNRDGSVQTLSGGDRVSLTEVRDAAGTLTSMEVTINNRADTVAVQLPEVIPAGISVHITNSNVQRVEVTVPVLNPTPGMVVTRIDPSGQKVIIQDCAIRADGLVFTIQGGASETISVADNTQTFTDVPNWAKDAVSFATARNLLFGTGNGQFSPLEKTNRSNIVTVLYHLANDPAAGEASFPDVSAGDLWYKPVAWASANGIMVGLPDGTFGGTMSLTREQLVTSLFKYANWMGCDVSGTASIDSFADAGDVSSYALQSVQWAVSLKLISGVGGNQLAPKQDVTRAELAAIVKNYCEVVLHKDIG